MTILVFTILIALGSFMAGLLGALVEHQFSGNLMSNLTGLGLPGQDSSKIADTVVSAGAQAGKVHLPGALPIAPGTLLQTIAQSFTDALHVSFATAGVALLLAGLISVVLLRQPRRQTAAETTPEQVPEIAAVPVEI